MDKKRILVIDDEATFTRILKDYLEGTGGYEVRTETSGRRGLKAASEFRPDLILLDVIMPDIDGGAVSSQLKEDRQLKDVPVVFLTAVVSKEEANLRAGLIGGQVFLPKPVSGKEVVACLERELSRSRSRSSEIE